MRTGSQIQEQEKVIYKAGALFLAERSRRLRSTGDSGLKEFDRTNPYKTRQELIHGIGAHEERHLFQDPSLRSNTYQAEKEAMKFEIFGRREYMNSFKKR